MLTEKDLYEVLRQNLPIQNDFGDSDYSELLEELNLFGITTKNAFFNLVIKHRTEVLEIDASPLDENHIEWYTNEYGKEYVKERLSNNFWFAYTGLLRIMLELEFGYAYKSFAEKRDNID